MMAEGTRSGGGETVLVTGATGFTGTHLTRRLVEAGHRVVAFVRASSDTEELDALGVDVRVVDIRDHSEVARAFDSFDRVYHIAAAFRTQHAEPDEFRRVNVDATAHLLASARECGVGRFVHCSTVGVQGEIKDPPATEEHPFCPGDLYQKTKLEGERLARDQMGRIGGPEITIVRPVGIYGPGDLRFLKLFRLIARGRAVMVGSGEVLYHLTYVDDLVRGMLLAGEHPEASGETFTLGGAEYTTLNQFTAMIADALDVKPLRLRVPYGPVYLASVVCDRLCRAVGISPPLYPRRVEFFSKDRAFDISKARTVLGYEPRVDLREGLRRTAEWYRREGLL
jgi:nucleoside-diphosphate-sugar epimerase